MKNDDATDWRGPFLAAVRTEHDRMIRWGRILEEFGADDSDLFQCYGDFLRIPALVMNAPMPSTFADADALLRIYAATVAERRMNRTPPPPPAPPAPAPEPLMVSPAVAAELLSVSRGTLDSMLEDGVIDSRKAGSRRLVSMASLRNYANASPPTKGGRR